MPFENQYTIRPDFLPVGTKRRSGLLISPSVQFLVAHDTGNPGSTAANNVRYYARTANEMSASAHLFVDDKEIIECIPALTAPPEKAWHVLYRVPTDDRLYGHDANDAAIGVEYCYGDNIDADEAYRKYVWVLARCCHHFNLDPATRIVGHFILDPQRKTDPVTGLARSRRSYDQLLRDVVELYQRETGGVAPAPPAQTPGVVRLTTTVRLNLRQGRPSSQAPIVRTMSKGVTLDAAGYTDDGERVNGNPRWYYDTAGNYFWSGGVQA